MNNRMLIIDDDEEMCAELHEILTDEGYEVTVALDGRTGKEIMEREQFEVIILDLKLPELNGYEVLKAAKESHCASKIIVLSGRPLGEDVVDEFKKGAGEEEKILSLADAVMNKPVLIPVLLAKIRQYLPA